MKNKFIIILYIILIIIIVLFFVEGLKKRTDVILKDYSVIENEKMIKLNITITSSMGYARDLKVKQSGDNKYITFYSTFGFLNSKIGAKSEYEIELNPSYTKIYFFVGDGEYKLVLKKDESTNEWVFIK